MKPARFDYVRPNTLREAVDALVELEGGTIIAGGQSLGPMLNLRLVSPPRLVDISRLQELRHLEESSSSVTFGACIRHGEFEDGKVPDATNGLMQKVAGGIAYRAIRNRGTIGGSVSLADPSADWITVLIALGAQFRIVGPEGEHTCEAEDMFLGPYTTAIGNHGILSEIIVPKLSKDALAGYYKISRKSGEYPMTTATVVRDRVRGISKVVLGTANRAQIVLERASASLVDVVEWSERDRNKLKAACREDIKEAGRQDKGYEIKLCETTVLRAALSASMRT